MSTFAHFDTTEGAFTIRLFDQEAPNTVANFVGLAEGTKEFTDPRTNEKKKAPFYDGIIFHRVIDGFMIQGGDPLGKGFGGPGFKFADGYETGYMGGQYSGGTNYSWAFQDEIVSKIKIMGVSSYYGSADCIVYGFRYAHGVGI